MRYVFVDKILKLDVSKYVLATKYIAPEEDYFADHFPGYPVVPGVLLVEMIGQTAEKCLIAGMGKKLKPVLLQIRQATFRKSVPPGSSLQIEAFIETCNRSTSTARGRILLEGETVAEASILFGFIPWNLLKPGFEDEVLKGFLEGKD